MNLNFLTNKRYSFLKAIFILIAVLSFILGFYYGENSAGGGPIDFPKIKNNYEIIFLSSFNEIDWTKYKSSRLPLLYFLVNIYIKQPDIFILKLNTFLISFLTPVFFYFALKEKAKLDNLEFDNKNLLIFSTIILLSPYFRTSAFWMLEENFGIFFIVVSIYFFYLSKNYIKYSNLFILFSILFSYFAFYSSQNLFFFVVLLFFSYFENYKFNNKNIIIVISNIIFIIPLIYFSEDIYNQFFLSREDGGSRIGFNISSIVDVGNCLLFFLPLMFFTQKEICYSFVRKLNIYRIFIIALLYISFFFIFNDYNFKQYGGGAFNKLFQIFDETFSLILVLTFSFVSWLFYSIYSINNKKIIIYLFGSLLIYSNINVIFQEYFDPTFLIFWIFFLNKDLCRNIFKNNLSIIYFIYYFCFLQSANYYYIFIKG